MPANITDSSAFTDPVQTVSDGDAASGTNFALAPQALSNRTRYLLNWVTASIEAAGAGTAIAADTNDFAPTGFATRDLITISATGATRNITGISATARLGKPLTLKVATGSQNITFTHADAASSAANRILTAGEKKQRLKPGDTIVLLHNGTNWQQIGGTCQRLETLDFSICLSDYADNGSWTVGTSVIQSGANNQAVFYGHITQLVDGDVITRIRAGAARGSATGAVGMRLRLWKDTHDKTAPFASGTSAVVGSTATGAISTTNEILSITHTEAVSGSAANYFVQLVSGDAASTVEDIFYWADLQVERYV